MVRYDKMDIFSNKRKRAYFFLDPDNEPETGCKVHHPGSKEKCPRCGSPLDDDGQYSIWCTNPKCRYRKELDRDDEPMDIGEIW